MDKIIFYKDAAGEWRWHRKNGGNGEITGASTEGYENLEDACQNAQVNSGLVIKLSMEGRHRQSFGFADPPTIALIDPKLLESL